MIKKIKIGEFSLSPRIISQVGAFVESHLKIFFDAEVKPVKNHTEINTAEFDLGLVQAQELEPPEFLKWLESFEKKRSEAALIAVPFIIITPINPSELTQFFSRVIGTNWYFDLVHPMQLQSLPIRVANLIRIKLHIAELSRYNLELDEMASKVENLEQSLQGLK